MAGLVNVQLKCTCGREVTLPRRALVARLRENKPPRCAFCAETLSVSADLLGEARAAAEAPAVGKCPACGLGAPAVGALPTEGHCKLCQLTFWCTGVGEGRFDRPARQLAADDELREARRRLEGAPGGTLIDWVFHQRQQQGTLEQGEAERLAEWIARITTWTRAGPSPTLPLPNVEVLQLLGPIIVRSQTVQVDEARNEVRTVNAMMLGGGPLLNPTSVDFGRFGARLLLTRGAGLTLDDKKHPSELFSSEVLYRLQPEADGTAISIWSQPEKAAPYERHSASEHAAFSQHLFSKRAVLIRYLKCLALAGAGVRGARALRVTTRAAAQRLVELGREPATAEREAAQFVVRSSKPGAAT
jgi:hypothetical protein